MSTPAELIARLQVVPAFASLDDHVLAAIAADAQRRTVPAGTTLVEEGGQADALFVVLHGQLVLRSAGGHDAPDAAARLGPGSIVGEIAVLTGTTRTATLEAVEDVEVAVLDADRFLAVLEHAPQLGVALARLASDRLVASRLRTHLGTLFPALPAPMIAEAVRHAELLTLGPGAVLAEVGEPADAAFVVVTGRVRLLEHDSDGVLHQPIPEVGPGELVAEQALLSEQRHTATVVAARHSVLARFPRTTFEALMLAAPAAMLAVTRRLLARHDNARTRFDGACAGRVSVALLALHDTVDLPALTTALASTLATMTPTARVDAAWVDAAVARSGAAQAAPGDVSALRVVRELDELEANVEVVLLEADPAPTRWSRRCLDRADHLVLVADATQDPQHTALERTLVPPRTLPHQRVSLLLVHPPEATLPRNTAAWLAPRDLDDHAHLRAGNPGDLGRFARTISGRAVWVALGGGGAKGFAHLGLLRALAEAGVPVDGIVGTSIGASLGTLVARDLAVDSLVEHAAPLFRNLRDYTAPVSGLLAGRRIAAAVEEGCQSRDIEDLWRPFRCLSTNLTRSMSTVHRTGNLARAVRASLSLPGVLPPVAFGDELHIDGGVLNNLPADVARRETPTGTVIASDVAPRRGPRVELDHGLYVHGGRVLLRRLTPGIAAPPVPGLIATLVRSTLVAAVQARDRCIEDGLADLLVSFGLDDIGLLDFGQIGAIAEQGYTESLESVRDFAEQWSQHPAAGRPGERAVTKLVEEGAQARSIASM